MSDTPTDPRHDTQPAQDPQPPADTHRPPCLPDGTAVHYSYNPDTKVSVVEWSPGPTLTQDQINQLPKDRVSVMEVDGGLVVYDPRRTKVNQYTQVVSDPASKVT